MLVLSRQAGERIMIGDRVEITILSVRADRVRIGIVAPAGVPVHRKEVYDEIQAANRDASAVPTSGAGALGKTLAAPPAFPESK